MSFCISCCLVIQLDRTCLDKNFLMDQGSHVEALEKRNDTMQLILLSVVLIAVSFVLSSLLPYALAFFFGVICGRTGFVSLLRHGSVGAYKVGQLIFGKQKLPSVDSKPATSEDEQALTASILGSKQITLHDRRASNRESHSEERRRRLRAKRQVNAPESSSDDEEVLEIDTASQAKSHRRNPRQIDFGHVVARIGSEFVNQWISN